ncbi:hypothetical protein NEDG_01103 [Nematocida displodere]|uniref:Cyclin N-terminal domain-containing protein n=1 Tax=Nematocida displodere TaxID=1805483 RepID=A0A177EAJ9_9MICR|nr:hypothetical protein NEDG_01103 [Nematocida displodere]
MDAKEYQLLAGSRDAQLLVGEVMARGKELEHLEGTAGIATRMVYLVLAKSLQKKKRFRFESLSCLVIGALSLAGKINGYAGKSCQKAVELQRERVKYFEGVGGIWVGERQAIVFTDPEHGTEKEASPESLLQTEVVLASILAFRFVFGDMHRYMGSGGFGFGCDLGVLGMVGVVPVEVKKTAWVILLDVQRLPLGLYFSEESIVLATVRVSWMIYCHKKHKAIIPDSATDDVIFLEKEIMNLFIKNSEATVGD